MSRCLIVYALNDKDNLNTAYEALNSVQSLLPKDISMRVFGTGHKDAGDVKMPSWVFGDIAQVFELSGSATLDDFHKSEAYAKQKQLTKGFFSNETTVSY
jgi:hypothetical protein